MDLETAEELCTLTGHTYGVRTIARLPERQIISGSSDNTIKIWNLDGKTAIFTFKGHTKAINAVPVTLDNKRMISVASDNTLKVWNIETWEELFPLKDHTDSVYAVAVLPDGRLISGSDDFTLKVWSLDTSEELSPAIGDTI